MARKPKAETETTLDTTGDKVAMDELLEAINLNGRKKELTVALTSSEMLTTARGTNTNSKPIYKTENILGGQEFVFLEAVRGAKRIIYRFKPMDLQPYTWIEVASNKVFETFPQVVDLFKGIPGFEGFEDDVTPGPAFPRYLNQFYNERQARLEAAEKAKQDAIDAEKALEASFYEDNELYGAFS